jgi:hypothetical protein
MIHMQMNRLGTYSDLSVDEAPQLLFSHPMWQIPNVDAALFSLNSTGANIDRKAICISGIDLLRWCVLGLGNRIRIEGWTMVQRETGKPACET